MNDTTNAVAPKQKKSRAERILDLKNQIAKLEQEDRAESLINNVGVNDKVAFNYGRGDKARVLNGTVTAVRDTAQGLQLKVAVGEGFDAQDLKIFARDITDNFTQNAELATPAKDTPATPEVSVERQQGYDGIYPNADPLANVA